MHKGKSEKVIEQQEICCTSLSESLLFTLQIRSLFWFYLIIMLGILVAYLFEIVTWLILGCVVNPNKYLPYSVATITLLVHASTTYNRCVGDTHSG